MSWWARGVRILLLLVILVSFGVIGVHLVDRPAERLTSVDAGGAGFSPRRMSAAAERAVSVDALANATSAVMTRGGPAGLPGCVDVRTSNGARVYSRDAEEPRVIASNTKLFTTAAALIRFGPDFRLSTRVLASSGTDGGRGSILYLVGGGDPYLVTSEFKSWEESQEVQRPDVLLESLADAVVAAGIDRVGGVVGDGGIFDSQLVPTTWSADLVAQKVAAPIAGLSLNRNIKDFAKSPKGNPVFAENPAQAAAVEFTRLLRTRGVRVDGVVTSGASPGGLREVAAVQSAPLAEIVREINEESDNFGAEMLTKRLGSETSHPATTSAGVTAIKGELEKVGVSSNGLDLVDGSGLSRNTASCAKLTDLLIAMNSSPLADSFVASLAVAGSTGTLKKRMVGTPAAGRLRAKTGSLSDVGSLSGYVDDGPGNVIVFAYVINAEKVGRIRDSAEDEMVRPLLTYPSVTGLPASGG